MMAQQDSQFLRHESCPKCSSKDNLARYSDHAYCFTDGCGYYEKNGEVDESSIKNLVTRWSLLIGRDT